MEVAERQRTYRWHKPKPDDDFFGFPGYIAGGDDVNNLPRELRFTLDEKKMEREWRDYMKSAGSCKCKMLKLLYKDRMLNNSTEINFKSNSKVFCMIIYRC